MESLPKESIYIIEQSKDGNREINCVTHYDNKIHKNTNIRNQYLHGNYQGVPEMENIQSINFNSLLEIIEANSK